MTKWSLKVHVSAHNVKFLLFTEWLRTDTVFGICCAKTFFDVQAMARASFWKYRHNQIDLAQSFFTFCFFKTLICDSSDRLQLSHSFCDNSFLCIHFWFRRTRWGMAQMGKTTDYWTSFHEILRISSPMIKHIEGAVWHLEHANEIIAGSQMIFICQKIIFFENGRFADTHFA